MINLKNQEGFAKLVLKRKGLHVVRFCALWSGPCQIMAPLYEEMQILFKNQATFYKIDVDEAPSLKEQFSITEFPTIHIYKNGVVVEIIIGLIARDFLIAKLEKIIT